MALRNFFKFREGEDPELVKPFLDHLEDFRWMIIEMVLALSVAMVLGFVFRVELVNLLQWPLKAVQPKLEANLQSLGVADSLTISFKLAFYAGIVLSFPFLLYFLAEFVLPALTRQEKRYVIPAVGIGFLLFLSGVTFCYLVVMPQTLAFFFKDAQQMGWKPTWTVHEYYAFTTQFVLGFGAAFELPVAVLLLVKLGFVDYSMLRKARPYSTVIILFLAAVITPTTDVLSLLCMCIPMLVLYEICIWIAWFMERREKKAATLDLKP